MRDERTYDVRVQVDGPMASAWVPCAFYRSDTFSHCGVNAVQFARSDGPWRILHSSTRAGPNAVSRPRCKRRGGEKEDDSSKRIVVLPPTCMVNDLHTIFTPGGDA